VFHFEVSGEGLLVGKELCAFFATFEVGLFFLFFGFVLALIAHILNIIVNYSKAVLKDIIHFPPIANFFSSFTDSSDTYSYTMKS
jgi:hypothetical protein